MCKLSLRKKVAAATLCLTMCCMTAAGATAHFVTSHNAASAYHVTADITAPSNAKALYCSATSRNVKNYKGSTSKTTTNK